MFICICSSDMLSFPVESVICQQWVERGGVHFPSPPLPEYRIEPGWLVDGGAPLSNCSSFVHLCHLNQRRRILLDLQLNSLTVSSSSENDNHHDYDCCRWWSAFIILRQLVGWFGVHLATLMSQCISSRRRCDEGHCLLVATNE